MILGGSRSKMQEFETKRKLLFECLDSAEKDLKGTKLDQSKKRSSSIEDFTKCDDNSPIEVEKISKFHGKESIFKKPELPIMKCLKPRVTPDYQVNPHKWKKYSLTDVDISDRTNTAAAFAFLRDIEIQKDRETESNSASDSSSKQVVFNKSVGIKRNLDETSDHSSTDNKPKLKGSKVVMPEYSIGKKQRKSSKEKHRVSLSKNENPVQSAKQLRLAHLEEDDNDDNE